MTVYVVLCGWFANNLFGVYRTIKQARDALVMWLDESDSIWEDLGDYNYHIITANGEETWASIVFDTIEDA